MADASLRGRRRNLASPPSLDRMAPLALFPAVPRRRTAVRRAPCAMRRYEGGGCAAQRRRARWLHWPRTRHPRAASSSGDCHVTTRRRLSVHTPFGEEHTSIAGSACLTGFDLVDVQSVAKRRPRRLDSAPLPPRPFWPAHRRWLDRPSALLRGRARARRDVFGPRRRRGRDPVSMASTTGRLPSIVEIRHTRQRWSRLPVSTPPMANPSGRPVAARPMACLKSIP